jgi:predicted small lipoprotein YifL
MISGAVALPSSGRSRFRGLLCNITFLALAALFGAIAGCGSGGGSGSTPSTNGTPPTNLVYPQTTISATVGQAIAADTPGIAGSVTTYSVVQGYRPASVSAHPQA